MDEWMNGWMDVWMYEWKICKQPKKNGCMTGKR